MPKKSSTNGTPDKKLSPRGKGKGKDLKARADGISGNYGGGSGIFSQFEGAKFSNKREWINSPYPADFKRVMSTFDRQELTRKMRWLAVNSGLIREIIGCMSLYSVGDGIKAQPASGDAEWDKLALAYFEDWANRPCEITGRYNWYEVQQIACRKVDVDGEIFALKTYESGTNRPLLQLIESHRIGTTNEVGGVPEGLFDGVLFNKWSAVISFNVIRSDGTGRLVPASSIMHIHHPEQVTGARAYSPLQHSINQIVDVLEIVSLEKLAQKANADIVRTITKESGQFAGDIGDFEAFGMKPQDYPNGVYNNPNEVGSFVGGKILALAPGEKLESHTSTRGSSAYVGMVEHLERGATQGCLPYEFVIEPNKAGAAMRLIVAKAERVFLARQQVLIHRLCSPTWAYVIANAIANGELPSPKTDNWHRVNWVTPRRVTVDAGREATANQKDIEMGIKSLSDHYAEQGMSFVEETERRAADARFIIDTAAKFGVPPSWIYRPSNTPTADIDSASTTSPASGSTADGFVPFPNPGNP